MREKTRSTTLIYLLFTIAITIAFGCRTLLPEPGLAPDEPVLTSMPGEVFPTAVIPTKNPPTGTLEPTAPSQPDKPEVPITREQKYYQITGSTEKDLRQQLNKLGPPDEETGKIFDARTDWVINWYFYYDKGGNECKIDRVDVSLSLTFTYPEWKAPAKAAPALVEKWNKYMEQLILHEEGHATLADEGAQAIYETIMDMPASATCKALGESTNAAAQVKIEELKQRQRDYDNETGHGKTQGAVFP